MLTIFYIIVFVWVGWLLLDGLLRGEVWVKGGSTDRCTRELDMYSFAHKVYKNQNPMAYWLFLVFYAFIELLFAYLFLLD